MGHPATKLAPSPALLPSLRGAAFGPFSNGAADEAISHTVKQAFPFFVIPSESALRRI
jgi:hypothetical protein